MEYPNEFSTEASSVFEVTEAPYSRKRIALVAHDNKKRDLLDWARFNRELLKQHDLVATGTTGRLLMQELDAPVTCLQSGPLGGDQQIGARIAEGAIDLLIFFWDPLEQQPHDTDIKALLRVAVVWNIPVACDRATADYLISSPLMTGAYERLLPDYAAHIQRFQSGPALLSGAIVSESVE
ncbi:MAG: methylglyoxal synthase [Chloroflexi bacterium]|jgi:methylglyoxal synthase|nr:methylglyoxal synthase [Anaerolineaceae bacterium]NMB89307.1 methylglyoxal synthase [Chloroflexota bacterium]